MESLHADAEICVASVRSKNGELLEDAAQWVGAGPDELEQPGGFQGRGMVRASRTEAATAVSEAGVSAGMMQASNAASITGRRRSSLPGGRRMSLVKQDVSASETIKHHKIIKQCNT